MKKKIYIDPRDIEWQSTRGTGAGGQHVNRTESVMQLKLQLTNSFTEWEPAILVRLKSLGKSYLVQDDYLLITANISRSQHQNRQNAWDKLQQLIHRASIPPKERRATHPTLNSIKKRLQAKQLHAKKKQERQRANFD